MNKSIFKDLRHWIFEEALPFWGEQGVDWQHGGFVERFALDGTPYTREKRVFVVCRQIYVFAHASMLGLPNGAALAEHGYRFLLKAALPEGGWARWVDETGRPIDRTPDLYVLSFVLFAIAWYYRVSGDQSCLPHARTTFDFVEATMREASGRGFLHERPVSGPLQQNPHMHLVEALLALAEFTGEQRFLDGAREIVSLFKDRLYDERTGTLPEFFADGWERLDSDAGRVTEPGHQFEWAWILANYRRLGAGDFTSLIVGLHASAERFGVDPSTQATYNAVRDDGLVLNKASRIWPNTERIKAAVALFEITGRPPQADIVGSARLLLDRYLAPPAPAGLWFDQLNAQGLPAVDKIPTSSLYHLFLAFAEVLRIESILPLDGAVTQSQVSRGG